eukprot:Rmarinus@m.15798
MLLKGFLRFRREGLSRNMWTSAQPLPRSHRLAFLGRVRCTLLKRGSSNKRFTALPSDITSKTSVWTSSRSPTTPTHFRIRLAKCSHWNTSSTRSGLNLAGAR